MEIFPIWSIFAFFFLSSHFYSMAVARVEECDDKGATVIHHLVQWEAWNHLSNLLCPHRDDEFAWWEWALRMNRRYAGRGEVKLNPIFLLSSLCFSPTTRLPHTHGISGVYRLTRNIFIERKIRETAGVQQEDFDSCQLCAFGVAVSFRREFCVQAINLISTNWIFHHLPE